MFENQLIDYDGQYFRLKRSEISPSQIENAVLLECHLSGLCGTDVRMIRGERECKTTIIGHEATATVVANPLGYGNFKSGDRVFINPNAGPKTLTRGHLGHDRPGLFQKYISFDAADCESHLTCKIPDSLDERQALFLEPLSCAAHTLDKLYPDCLHQRVLLFGAGSLALAHTHILAMAGVEKENIFVCNRNRERAEYLAVAGGLPGKNIVCLTDAERLLAVQPQICLLLNSNADTYIHEALETVADGGTILIFGGIANSSVVHLDNNLKADLLDVRLNESRVHAAYQGKRVILQGSRGFKDRDTLYALDLLQASHLPMPEFIGNTLSPSEFTQLLNNLSDPAQPVPAGKQVCNFGAG